MRLVIALLVGAASAAVAAHFQDHSGKLGDFQAFWWSAKALSLGLSPYDAIGPNGTLFKWNLETPYPLPGILILWPLTLVPLRIAFLAFTFVSAAALAWQLSRDHRAAMWVFVSGSFLVALYLGQWSPLLTAAALSPWLGILLVAKPTIGAALFLYRPSWIAVISGLLLLVLSLLVMPSWPVEWWGVVRQDSMDLHYRIPLTIPGGVLVLLALLRWKRPESRLLVAMACVPQTMVANEFVPLFLVVRKRWEGLTLALLSWVMLFLRDELARPQPGGLNDYAISAQLGVLLLYLPAVAMVLRRPNEGDTPELIAQVRRWLTWPARLRRPATP